MLKATTLAVAIGAIAMLFAFDAGALPLAAVKSQANVESNTTLVRDDCGRDRHFSERQNKCVDNDEDNDRDRGGRRHAGKSRKELCRQRCLDIREDCNARRGGFFNGCGVQATSCMASC
jgi:hypothetical protein